MLTFRGFCGKCANHLRPSSEQFIVTTVVMPSLLVSVELHKVYVLH